MSTNPSEFQALYDRIEEAYKRNVFDIEKMRIDAEQEIREKADQFEEHYNQNHLNNKLDGMTPEEQKKYFEKNEEHIKEMQKNAERSESLLSQAEEEFKKDKSGSVEKKNKYERLKSEHERLITNLEIAVEEHKIGVAR